MGKRLRVLVACEESQAECIAWRELGHLAFSCDIQPCKRNGKPEWHIWGDVTELLQGRCHFQTMDGKYHNLEKWDVIIAHPPCTYLCKVSSVRMMQKGVLNKERYEKMLLAREFFMKCLNSQANYVAVENPLPMARAELPKPTCYACPSWFGVKYTKKSLYWLKNLPPIMAEKVYSYPKEYVRNSKGKYRSRTFPEMAVGIARQWSKFIFDDMQAGAQEKGRQDKKQIGRLVNSRNCRTNKTNKRNRYERKENTR